MTSPITPNPSIHTDPTQAPSTPPGAVLSTLRGQFSDLPRQIIQLVVNAILGALGLSAIEGPVDDLLLQLQNALTDIPEGNIAGLASALEHAGDDIINAIIGAFGGPTTGTPIENMIAALENIPAMIANALTGLPIVGNGIATIESWIGALLGFLGLGGGGSSALGQGSQGATIPPITTFLNLLNTGSTIPPATLKALAPGASKNVLNDATFDTFSDLQGQSSWCWDGWLGTGAFSGINSSVRTRRPGRITIYYMVGTTQGVYMFGGEPVNIGGDGQTLEYLRDPAYHTLVDWVLTRVDPTYFEWVLFPYPAAEYPMGTSVYAGVQWLREDIKATSSPFIFVMDSQGNQVGSAVYDQLRFGDMQEYRSRLLGAIAMGNLRREEGHSFPGYPDPAPGTSGMCCVSAAGNIGPYTDTGNPANPKGGNLIDTEDLWWDFVNPGDYFAATPVQGVTVDPGPNVVGGNQGCIAGIPAISLRQFYAFINMSYTGSPNIITDAIKWGDPIGLLEDYAGSVYQQIQNLGNGLNTPHTDYINVSPLADKGDDRTFAQIALDYIASFANEDVIVPPEAGERAQLLGQPISVQPYQVVTAGGSFMWYNVECTGAAFIIGVNAYDDNDNLIGTITAQECVYSNPSPNSNWNWESMQADFVMPAGTATARLLFDVEPDAMRTGIVWFDSAIFEPSTIIDAKFLDVTNMPQLTAAQMAGPQGEADLLTAWQNLIDSLASASGQTSVTGVQVAQMFQSVGQSANNAANALNLGVSHERILGNPATQHLWDGLNVSGQSTFPLPTGTLPTTTITVGTSLIGFLNTSAVAKIGFVEFMAEASSPTGIYLNVYNVSTTTGDLSILWSSSDISADIGSSLGWIGVTIPSVDEFTVTVGQVMAWEIVAEGSAVTVVAETLNVPNKTYLIPPNVGASRTVASTGGISPATLTPSQLGYGGTAPWVCMSVSALPPTFYAPSKSPLEHPGIYTYTIPSYLESGDLIDVVPCSAGGAAGWADGNQYSFLGMTFGNLYYGQGGQAGKWSPKTFVYGIDVPTDVTQLTVINGFGGCAPSGAGGDTVIGYGTLTTPAFDAIGTGDHAWGSTLSWTHAAAQGAYVIVCVNTGFGSFDIKYGNSNITPIPLGLVYSNNVGGDGAVCAYGFPNVPGGEATITFNTGGTVTNLSGNSISFIDVSSIGLVNNTAGYAKALSQSVMCGTNQMAVSVLGNMGVGEMSNFAGGTHAFYGSNPFPSIGLPYATGIAIDYGSGSSLTFTADVSVTDAWSGITILLNPKIQNVLLTVPGGQSGGPGQSANYNPANPNTTSNGPGPGSQAWAGQSYAGGNDTASLAFPGNFPGGAGSGGTSAVNGVGPYPANSSGANSATYITARQGNSAGTSIGGLGNGGGSELTVVYEAAGAGALEFTANQNNISWTHDSQGGSSAAVVMFGTIDYSNGAVTLSATYGGVTLNWGLGGITYYNANNVGIWTFMLGLIGIPSGTQTVTLGATGATVNAMSANTFTYQNVGTFGDFITNDGTGTNASLTGLPSGSSGSLVVGGFGGFPTDVFSALNQTTRWNQNNTNYLPLIFGDASGAISENFTATDTGQIGSWGAVGGLLIPAS